ncbi:uncharacterized protein METZ01_LOCUS130866 [marine metagenome]|uniref:Uncharacterized protein n=1 Tax=marine metagenome TaxID=408172 RepID=A0A381YN32_9ZZZZ
MPSKEHILRSPKSASVWDASNSGCYSESSKRSSLAQHSMCSSRTTKMDKKTTDLSV